MGRGPVGPGVSDPDPDRHHGQRPGSVPLYNNHVRAGTRRIPGDLINGQPRDAADDNYNSFDPYPAGTPARPPAIGRARRRRLLRPRRGLAPAGRADPPVRHAGRHQRHAAASSSGTAGPAAAPTPRRRSVGPSANSPAISGPRACPAIGPVLRPRRRRSSFPWTTATDASPSRRPGHQQPGNRLRTNNNPLHGFESFQVPQPGLRRPPSPRNNVGGSAADRCEPVGRSHAAPCIGHGRRSRPTTTRSIRQRALRRPQRGRRDEPLSAQPAARLAVRSRRPGVALPPAGRRRHLADQPAGPAGPDQLHQPGRRPAPAAALRDRYLGAEQLRLGQRQPGQRVPEQQPLPRSTSHHLAVPPERELCRVTRDRIPRLSPTRRWPTATRRSTSTTRCRSPTIPTSRSARSGSPRPTSTSRPSCRPGPSTRPRSWPSSASS